MGASTHQSPRHRRADELAYVARCLTGRDRQIVEAVARFGVFTAEHIAEMYFDSLKRAQVRLQRLHALRVLDRFQPYREGWGSSPYHYILGRNGIEAASAGGENGRSQVRKSRGALALQRRRELDRVLLVNGVYARLVADARQRPIAELQDWLSADEVAAWSEGLVSADAFGRWAKDDSATEFFLAVDRGGTWTNRVRANLDRYERFSHERGAAAWVLLVLTSERREAAVHAAVGSDAPVATSTMELLSGQRTCWLPLGDRCRLSLADFPVLPAVPGGLRAWRYRRPWSADEDDTEEFVATRCES